MSLNFGRSLLAIPGPSIMPDRVLQAMHRPAPDIYSGALVEAMPQLVDDLRSVARTKEQAAIYIVNGHAAWEAAMAGQSPQDYAKTKPALARALETFSG